MSVILSVIFSALRAHLHFSLHYRDVGGDSGTPNLAVMVATLRRITPIQITFYHKLGRLSTENWGPQGESNSCEQVENLPFFH